MAWQGVKAPTPQIAANAVLKPAGRNPALKAIQQRFSPNHALTGLLGYLATLFKRRVTVDSAFAVFP
jgi:hypothetical protein